jgi:hypothetical protein
MTKGDRQKLNILAVLLAVFGLTAVLGYRMMQPPTVTTAQTPDTTAQTPEQKKKTTTAPVAGDARIRLDLLEQQSDDDIGKKNLFQYRQTPPPPGSASNRGSGPTLNPPMPVNPSPAPVLKPPGPAGPPPPPPIALKFQGFAVTQNPTRGLTAFLSDDSRHYNVTVGDVLMGRYRIVSITDKTVEVEDLQYNRRQTLPLLK